MRIVPVFLLPLVGRLASGTRGPFLEETGDGSWVIGNDLWNVTQGSVYATKLFWQGVPGTDLVGSAYGHYIGYGRLASFPKATAANDA